MNQKNVTLYESQQRSRMSAFEVYRSIFTNLIAGRWLIWILFARDYFMANKRSVLGAGWLFLAPMLTSVSWILMNLLGVLNTGDIGVPFPLFVLIGTSFWVLFNNSYINVLGLFSSASGMLGLVKFPHEILIIVQVLKALANFIIASVLNIVILLAFGVYPTLSWLLLPLVVIPLVLLGVALGLIFTIIQLVIPDLEKVFAFFFPMLMYVTPIVFLPTERSDRFLFLITYNPLTYLLGVPRDIVVFGASEAWGGFIIVSACVVVLFLVILRAFYIAEEKVIEHMY